MTNGSSLFYFKDLIYVTDGRFPRVVRVPPRSLCSLRGHTWTHFSRWSRRLSLHDLHPIFNRIFEVVLLHFVHFRLYHVSKMSSSILTAFYLKITMELLLTSRYKIKKQTRFILSSVFYRFASLSFLVLASITFDTVNRMSASQIIENERKSIALKVSP